MEISQILEKKVDYSDELDNYKSKFNFEEFEITEQEIISELTHKEEKIVKNIKLIQRHSFEFSKTLYETHELLANHKTGAFVAWFTNLGLNKNIVYRAIDKYELVLETNNRNILNLPYRVVDVIKKSELSGKEINDIVKLEDTKQIVKTINDIKENKEKNNSATTIDIENEITKLKKKKDTLYKKIEEIDNLISNYEEKL
jgi:hypothetical protein